MRINYNLSAMLTNTQLLRNEKNQQSAAERLASGLKINHAKDDPAGMAISNKMDVQTAGLGQASRNSSDGISVIETADSSLNEVTSIIQRMRELAVQAANDTNALEDREAIQAEIDSLTDEVDRVSKNTEFNKKVLLDGSLQRRSYTNNRKVTVTNVGEGVPTDKYGISITSDARQAVFRGALTSATTVTIDMVSIGSTTRGMEVDETFEDGKLKPEAAGKVTINGQIIEFYGGETYEEIYQKLRTGAEIVDVNCIATVDVDEITRLNVEWPGCEVCPDASGKYEDSAGYMPSPSGFGPRTPLVFVSKEYGSAEKLNISCDNAILATALGLASQAGVPDLTSPGTYNLAHKATAYGTANSPAEIMCYRSTDKFLPGMSQSPIVLDENNPSHKAYFDKFKDDINTGGAGGGKMVMPALVVDDINGEHVVDLSIDDNKKYTTFFDKVDSLPAELEGNIEIGWQKKGSSGSDHDESVLHIDAGDTAADVFKKISEAAAAVGIDVFLTDDERSGSYSVLYEDYNYSQALVFRDKSTGRQINVKCDNSKLALLMGLPVCEWSVSGKDCKAEFTDGDPDKEGVQRIGFGDSATITTKGNKVLVTDRNGFELEMEAEKKTCRTYYSDWTATGRIGVDETMEVGDQVGDVSGIDTKGFYSSNFPKGDKVDIVADVTGYGMMTVHVGANEDQVIEMDIPEISAKTLNIDDLNVRSGYTADKALVKLDEALTKVSKVRSKLGAYQNRLEHTIASLDAAEEDLTASVSRIRDVDMAKETTEYTQHTILVQAATSVLAQANDLPQQALQLIQ
ncbi:MAG: hypothetical protein IK152_02890 [Lachnospiraceae bacterium]|nr:hypothetical protein [Lachnospiraceae bacterium]